MDMGHVASKRCKRSKQEKKWRNTSVHFSARKRKIVMELEERRARQDLIRKRIRTILIETGLSQAAIADMFDIPANVICQYVNKKITPSPARIAEICEGFGEDPRWVLGMTDKRGNHE